MRMREDEKTGVRSHEKLALYRMAHDLAVQVHKLSLKLPRLELYEEAPQVRRSSKSVASQIVEGRALRRYKADYLRYLNRAYASSEETMEHIHFLLETGSAEICRAEWVETLASYDRLTRSLFKYVRAVEEQHKPGWGSAEE